MRLAYLLRYYPTVSETFVYREIDGVQAHHPVELFALGSRADGAIQHQLPQVPVHRVPRRALLHRQTRGSQFLTEHQRRKDAQRLDWLRKRMEGFDHIHVHFAGEAAEMAHALWLDLGIPYSVTVHAVDLFKPRPSLATVLGHAKVVFTIAGHHQDRLAQLGIESEINRCGPDPGLFFPRPLPEGPLRVLFAGRDVPKKGLDTLLQAWDPTLGTLTLVTNRTVPEARCPGLLSHDALAQEMAKAHLVVLPCMQATDGDMDGIPLVLMEAMAMGRPVITTPLSGIPELVNEQVGWLVPPGDADALRHILQTHSAAERAVRGGHGPRRLVEAGFTLEGQVAGLLQHIT